MNVNGGNVQEGSAGWDQLHYDHRSSKVTVAPWDLWKRLRDQCPAIHSDHYGGFWFVSRHEDVNRVLVDWETLLPITPARPGSRRRTGRCRSTRASRSTRPR